MADTTFELAKRCPATGCNQAGKEVAATPIPQGGRVHTFECQNERCTRHGERWIVQTNPDGSIPQRREGPKTFPKLNHFSASAQRAREELQILEIQSLHPNLTRREIIRILGG